MYKNGISFFTVGGTIRPGAAYVVRPADAQLHQAIQSAEYCNVLTSRQMGKSSLMAHALHHLREAKRHAVTIDLTNIGTRVSEEQWYLGIIMSLVYQLDLDTKIDVDAWWQAHASQGAVQRFSDFLRDVLLQEIAEPIVIFIDEIDSTLNLPFTDDFFAAIRALYNARASNPIYERLTFVLLGVARPADLIKDRTRTPYNIGRSIELTDFSPAEAETLLPGLDVLAHGQTAVILERILYWTNGHPYLTQKVCAEVALNSDEVWDEAAIDALVQRLFLSDEARKESNLQYISRRILESQQREGLLHIYQQVLAGKSVPDDERDPIRSQLKLTGLVKVSPQDTLVVRNRIYTTVFDSEWVKANLPQARPIESPPHPKPRSTPKWVMAVLALVVVIAVVWGGQYWYTTTQQRELDIQAQTYTEAFHNTQSSAVQIENLANLFGMGGDYESQARETFFEQTPEEQIAMFEGLDQPEQSAEALKTVVWGLYEHVDQSYEHKQLLRAMLEKLEQTRHLSPEADSMSTEIDLWLQGREQADAGNYVQAAELYTQALEQNDNPAIYYDRAWAYKLQGMYLEAVNDLNRVVELDPSRQTEVETLVRDHPELKDILLENTSEFPTLAELVTN